VTIVIVLLNFLGHLSCKGDAAEAVKNQSDPENRKDCKRHVSVFQCAQHNNSDNSEMEWCLEFIGLFSNSVEVS